MFERGEQLRFAVKSRNTFAILRKGFGQNLDGHIAGKFFIVRPVDLSHATGPNTTDDFVMSQTRSRSQAHFRRDYTGPEISAVNEIPVEQRGTLLSVNALHFDTAVGNERGDRSDCGQHWREDRTDDANGQRKLSDRSLALFNDDSPDVALLDKLLQFVEYLATLGFYRFPPRFLGHDLLL